MAPVKLWLPPTDPRGLDRAPAHRPRFDPRPHRNRGMRGIANHCSTREWDNRIIATMVALGCPRDVAEEVRTHPPARYAGLLVWTMVQHAAAGDPRAKACVDRYREIFARQARGAVAEMLGALEQPAHASELQTEMGL